MIKSSDKNMIDRSSRPKMLCEKGVLRNFAKFTGRYLCQSLFFKKVASVPGLFIRKQTPA